VIYDAMQADVLSSYEAPAPTILAFSEDYWHGEYVFNLVENHPTEGWLDAFFLVMTADGQYRYEQKGQVFYDYIYQVGPDEFFTVLNPRKKLEYRREVELINVATNETNKILDQYALSGHRELLIEDGYFVTLGRAEVYWDTIEHINGSTGNRTTFWNPKPYYPEDPCVYCEERSWLHGNDVSISFDGQHYLVNMRNADNIVKVHRETGDVAWICGRNGNFTLYDELGTERSSLWYHSHVIKEIRPNVFLMFDNDLHNLGHAWTYPLWESIWASNYGGQSRLIEFTVFEENMTAYITWTYQPSSEYYCGNFGDVDILPNGNILGTFGTGVHRWTMTGEVIEEPFGASLHEVNRETGVVRIYKFPIGFCIYRTQQVSEDPADFVDISWIRE